MTAVAEPVQPVADPPRASALSGFNRDERIAIAATSALPFPALLYLGLNAGGFAPATTGIAATVLALLLALRAVVAPRTVRKPAPVGMVALVALLALAGWSLASMGWSHSPVRAIAEFDRTVLYALGVALFVTLPRVPLRPVLLAVGAAAVTLVLVGLATRLRPDLFPVSATVSPQRLSYPLGYWNALGVLAAMALVLSLHAAADGTGRLPVRVLGAAVAPALVTALYLTLSRGGIGAAVVGIVLYVVLGRTRGLVLAAVAMVVPCYLALQKAYDATALVSPDPSSALGVAQGRTLLSTVVVCVAAAGLIRLVLSLLDHRLLALPLPTLEPRRRAAAWVAAAAVFVAVGLAAGGVHQVRHQYERFVSNAPTNPIADPRARLGEVYNSGRIGHWRVALEASRHNRFRGVGAGTFDMQWNQLRPYPLNVTQAHSLYVEMLSENGIVGLVLLVSGIGALLTACALRWRTRPPAAAAVAVVVAWALHAALDWDWEVPAVTLVPLLLGAAAAAGAVRSSRGRRRATPVVVGVGALALALLPAATALGESRIGDAIYEYDHGRCLTATIRADQARSLLPMRPEPYAVLALCAARNGQRDDALRLGQRAVQADPEDWEWRYMNALVTGSVGGDPRPELRAARFRNPLGIPPTALDTVLKAGGPSTWAQRSGEAYVWIHGRAHGAISPLQPVQSSSGRKKG
jgi:hypothetical protein